MADSFFLPPDVERDILEQGRQRRQQRARLVASITPEQVARATELTQKFPNASRGAVETAAVVGVPDEDFEQIANMDDGGFSPLGLLGNVVGFASDSLEGVYNQAIKPVIRGIFTTVDSIAQEAVQRPMVAASAAVFGDAPSFQQAYNDYGDSAGLNILQGDYERGTEEGVLGKGFFAGGAAQAESQQERTLTIQGNRANFGNAMPIARMTGEVFGYDSTAHSVVAGVTQLAADVLLDPTAIASGGSTALARNAARLGASAKTQTVLKGGVQGAMKARRELSAAKAVELGGRVGTPPKPKNLKEWEAFSERRATGARSIGGKVSAPSIPEGASENFTKYTNPSEGGLEGMHEAFDGLVRNMVDDAEYQREVADWLSTNGLEPDDYVAVYRGNGYGDGDGYGREFTNVSFDKEVADTFSERVRGDGTPLTRDDWLNDDVMRGSKFKGSDEMYVRVGDIIGVASLPESELIVRTASLANKRALQAERAGLIEGGGRRSVDIDKALDFLGDRKVGKRLAESDAYAIFQARSLAPGKKASLEWVRDVGRTADESEAVARTLDEIAVMNVTEKGFYRNLGRVRQRVADSHLSGLSPSGKLSHRDLDDAAEKIDSLLRVAKIGVDDVVDESTGVVFQGRRAFFDKVLDITEAPANQKGEKFAQLYDELLERVSLEAGGIESYDEIRKSLSLSKVDDLGKMRKYDTVNGDDLNSSFGSLKVDGTPVPSVGMTAHLADEFEFYIPKVQDLRQAVRMDRQYVEFMEKLGTPVVADKASDFMRWSTTKVFKPAAILRPAYIVRIGAEEQLRLAASGMDSLFTHPFRFMMHTFLTRTQDGKMNDTARRLVERFGPNPIPTDRALSGDDLRLVGEHTGALNIRAYNVADELTSSQRTDIWDNLAIDGSDASIEAWSRQIGQHAASREVRWLAQNGGDIDGFVTWARNTPEGKEAIERLAEARAGLRPLRGDDDALRTFAQERLAVLHDNLGGTVQRTEDGRYIVTQPADERLIDMVAAGKTNRKSLKGFYHQGIHPPSVKVERASRQMSTERKGALDTAINWMFDNITGKPTNALARYPALRQKYVQNMERFMEGLESDELRAELMQRAEAVLSLTRKEKEGLARAAVLSKGKKGAFKTVDELDEILRFRSGEDVKDLLFDVTRRSNFQEAYEVMFPFYDAWKEVTQTWAGILKENPAFFLKAMQGVESGRESGVIYANDFGEEVFAYPGGGILSDFFAGGNVGGGQSGEADLRFEGRLQGANIVATGVGPGFGPMVQWGVGAFMGKDRNLAALREFLAPFGTGGVESASDLANPGTLVESFVPAWARKLTNAATGGDIDPVQFNSTMGDVMKVLAMSGEYEPGNVSDQQRLLEDAEQGARRILFYRGLVQGTAITGPTGTWQVKTDGAEEGEVIPTDWDPEADPDGTFHSIGILANEYRRLLDHFNYDDELASATFIDMFGVKPGYLAQAKTRSVSQLPVDEEGNYWIKDHSDFAKEYPSVVGYFVPADEDAELDYSIYRQQIADGDRQSLTAKQQLQLANQTIARSFYSNVKRKLDAAGIPSAAKKQALSNVKVMLEEKYEGWQNDVLGVDAKLSSSKRITQLAQVVDDPRVADSPVVASLSQYMKVRAAILQAQGARGLTTNSISKSEKAADLREALTQIGMTLQSKDENFAGLWARLLSTEVEE